MSKPWLTWKYDLCENEIQCEGRTIAYADNSLFDIKDKAEFSKALQAQALKLVWLIERANSQPDLLEACENLLWTVKELSLNDCSCGKPRPDFVCLVCHAKAAIKKAKSNG